MNLPVESRPTAAETVVVPNRALRETLELLEWPLLCEHLSTFAATAMGREAARNLQLPDDLNSSRTALSETVELLTLDELQEGGLSFRGVRDLRPVVLRCSKGESPPERICWWWRPRHGKASAQTDRGSRDASGLHRSGWNDGDPAGAETALKFVLRMVVAWRIEPAIVWQGYGGNGTRAVRNVGTNCRS